MILDFKAFSNKFLISTFVLLIFSLYFSIMNFFLDHVPFSEKLFVFPLYFSFFLAFGFRHNLLKLFAIVFTIIFIFSLVYLNISQIIYLSSLLNAFCFFFPFFISYPLLYISSLFKQSYFFKVSLSLSLIVFILYSLHIKLVAFFFISHLFGLIFMYKKIELK